MPPALRRPPFGRLLMLVLLLTGADRAACAGPPPDIHVQAAVTEIERAASPQPGGGHLPRLFALRQLRDPALAPVFRHLLEHRDWTIQVHGALGLAELADPPRLDPSLTDAIAAPSLEPLVANALDMDLIGAEERAALLARADLPALPRLLLTGETLLAAEGGVPVEVLAEIRPLVDDGDPRVAVLARALLLAAGANDVPGVEERIDPLPRRERIPVIVWLLEAIRQFELEVMLPWVQASLSDPAQAATARHWGVLTALQLDPVAGLAAWEQQLGSRPSYPDRVRYGLLLLASGAEVPASPWRRLLEELPDSDRIVRAMAALGQARARGSDTAARYIALLELSHPATTDWILTELENLPPETAIPICEHLVEMGTAERATPESVELAVEATGDLFRLAPDRMLQRLGAADDDERGQEVLLLGLFDHRDARIGAEVARIPRLGAGRADALALLLVARYAEALEDDDRLRLGMIAAGGGRVSEGLRAQAAWLYLRHVGAVPEALRFVADATP